MRAAIEQYQPRVVFVDPLTNSAELRVLDVERLLDDADQLCRRETWFVIDGTLLSGQLERVCASAPSGARALLREWLQVSAVRDGFWGPPVRWWWNLR